MKLLAVLSILACLGLALAWGLRGSGDVERTIEPPRVDATSAAPAPERIEPARGREPQVGEGGEVEFDGGLAARGDEREEHDDWPTHSPVAPDRQVVRGRLVDARTGRPRAGVVLELAQSNTLELENGWAVVTTDSDGCFRTPACFQPHVPRGRWSILVDHVAGVAGGVPDSWIEPCELDEIGEELVHVLRSDDRTASLRFRPDPPEGASEDATWLVVQTANGRLVLREPLGSAGGDYELFVAAQLELPFFAFAWTWTGPEERLESSRRPPDHPPWWTSVDDAWQLASAIVRVEALGGEVHRIPMAAPAHLAVRLEVAGAPVSEHFTLHLRAAPMAGTWRSAKRASPADPWRFHALPPGDWVAEVAERREPSRLLATERFTLEPGEQRELALELGEELRPRRAVAGRFVSPNDGIIGPRPFLVRVGDGPWFEARAHRDGSFEVLSVRRADSVHLVTDPDITWERAEPPELEQAFGADDVRILLAPEADTNVYELQLLDATTGAPVAEGARAVVYGPWQRELLARSEPMSDFDGGEWRATLPPRAGLRWRAVAAGYRAAEGAFPPPAPDEPYTVVRVPLERGLLLDLRVVEAGTLRPLENARVLDGAGRELARSDAHGVARLAGERWPARLTVERAGHFPFAWSADQGAPRERVELAPD